jgi:peptidoglycan/xylan/chitin deacetylase (PgdA/CDA1 family)
MLAWRYWRSRLAYSRRWHHDRYRLCKLRSARLLECLYLEKVVLRRLAKSVLATSTGWKFSAPLRAGHVVALMYHRINPDIVDEIAFSGLAATKFREQMLWLKKNCTPIWPEEILDAAKISSRIRPPVVVTFDDGYRDYHDRAYPILDELKIPAVVFLSTQYIDSSALIWTEAVHRSVMMSARLQIEVPWSAGIVESLATSDLKRAFIRTVKLHLKGIRNEARKTELAALFHALDVPCPEQGLDRQMLTWDEVRSTFSGTRYGGHSHTHPILSQLSPSEVEIEIETCKNRLQAETGVEPELFAYPNGREVDFNTDIKDSLRRNGFKMAFSTVPGGIDMHSDVLALPRQHSGDYSPGGFAALVARA